MQNVPALAQLPSGRIVRVVEGPVEAVEIRAADGTLEIRVVLEAGGASVQVRAARMELVADEKLTMRAPAVDIVATEGVTVAGGEAIALSAARVEGRADAEVSLAAPLIRLN